MKNSKLRRALTLAACAVMLVCLSVGATLAYLTSKTEVVTNTFTVGKVKITLDEAAVNPDGTYVSNHDNRRTENSYKLLPGHTYIKDPTVTLKAGSEKCYIRMIVTVNNIADLKEIFPNDVDATTGIFLIQNFVTGWDSSIWNFYSASHDATADTTTYVFHYFAPIENLTDNDLVLDDLFETIVFPGTDVTDEDIAALVDDPETEDVVEPALQITVVAHAIQSDGFEATADKTAAEVAWEAFDSETTVQ